ncbi:ribonuclease YeeF family protein [Bacillus haynesii]|uniref:ribonuclease YeeF family protein n=3 Tax=Bacillus haynesii TaxID=1925021 RepID=UPI002DB68F41|nr:T7SS effector LXG polymorphic toxin [Bacillus haynesii]MEC1530456.1 T7SS effector LXG polymorphic toxin [Bacillus haynesii]
MKIYEAESLISAMEARSHEYKKMREQFVNLQRAFMGVADLGDDFQGKGADNIKAFFKEHARNIEEWLGMIDMQIAFLDSIAGTLEEAGLAGNTFVDTSYLENELETAYKKSNEIVAGQKQAMKTILEDIKDIIPLEVFSTFDFKQHISNAKVVKDNTVDKIHETDWKLKNEYEKSELNQDYIEERSKALLDATGKGKSAQPINFNAKAYYDTKVFKYRDEIHKKTEEYLTIKKEEAEKRRIEELKAKLATLKDNPDEYLKVAKEIGYDNLTSEQMNYVTAIEEAYEFKADPIKGTLEDGKHVLESMKGFVVGGYEFAKDTIQGTIETGKALIGHADNFIKNPKATVNSVLEYDYKATFESMLQSIADSWDEKMVHGDSYSRGHYIAYAIGTIWGLAEAGPTVVSGSKSLGKAGKAAAQTAKKSVNSVKQHFSPPKNRYTPALEGMLQRAGEAPNVKNTPLLRELLEDKKKSVLFNSNQGASGQTVKKVRKTIVPTVKSGEFNKWFNSLSTKQLDELWSDKKIRRAIERQLRAPGGMHEWHLVSRAPTFKHWGVTAEQIRELRTAINEVEFVNPTGKHGGLGSTAAHNELLKIIDSSKDYNMFVRRLNNWANYRLKGGVEALPEGLRIKK